MEMLSQGAEAKIFAEGDKILKDRFSKSYRIPELDKALRQVRTRRESKVLSKLEALKFPAPRLLGSCDKSMRISMSRLGGEQLKNVLDFKLAREVGSKVGFLHKNGIIHSDLTTSNMILDKEIKFLDFGLSFFSDKAEDKAVDLHLFEQALESRHSEIFDECKTSFYEGYKESYDESEKVLNRLDIVKKRGRYKRKN